MAKKSIGFIDLYIDEWHANNYPAWFASSKLANEFELGYAWEEYKNPNGIGLADWCAKNGMKPAASIAEVIEKSDCICVLAPSNPEAHARLSELPLAAGKPLYIDKTFAPDKATAISFFEAARKAGTPLMSSSALRYGNELVATLADNFADTKPMHMSTFGGGGNFPEYSIHQIEMIVTSLGIGAKSVKRLPDCDTLQLEIKYADNRRSASMVYSPYLGFSGMLIGEKCAVPVTSATNMFPNLIDKILEFFATGVSLVPEAETIEVAAIREAAVKAFEKPGIEFGI